MNSMQTETITQIKKFKLEFEKFDDWVYIKCSDRKDPFLLPRKHFDTMEAKHPKGYNWLLKIRWVNAYVALSEDYLKQYFETGNWSPQDYNTWIVDPLPLLRADVKNRYYQADVSTDGFLHFDGKLVRRPYCIELHGYHSKQEVIKKLQKNPKVISAEIGEIPYYNQGNFGVDEQQSIHIVYMPSVREFNKLVAYEKAGLSYGVYIIERRLGIKRFKQQEAY